MPPARPITPDTLKEHDSRIRPGDEILAKIRHATDLIPGKVDHANRKTFVIRLDAPAHSADGKILYPAGAELRIPRIPHGQLNIPADGYCLLAPGNVQTEPFPAYQPTVQEFRPRGMLATLKEQALLSLWTARQRAVALQAELGALSAEIGTQEAALLAAFEAGAVAPKGFALSVEVKVTPGRITPAWKDEAIALATAAGQKAADYEAAVRARTPKSPDAVRKTLRVEKLP